MRHQEKETRFANTLMRRVCTRSTSNRHRLSACHRLASCNIPYSIPNMATNTYTSMKGIMVDSPFVVYLCFLYTPKMKHL